MTHIREMLQAELDWRASQGWQPVSVAQFEAELRAIGYRRDTSMECRSIARYMTGERAGESYPSCDTTPVETDSGLRFCNADADRGARYAALQELRACPLFAVSGNYILEF